MDDFRAILYDTVWQNLRVRLKGSWSSVASARRGLARLQAYLEASSSELDLVLRLHRVTNYLTQVHEHRDLLNDSAVVDVALFNKSLLPVLAVLDPKYPVEQLPEWDWDLQLSQLRSLKRADSRAFQQLLADLSGRLLKLPQYERGPLERYLSLMRKVSNETLI